MASVLHAMALPEILAVKVTTVMVLGVAAWVPAIIAVMTLVCAVAIINGGIIDQGETKTRDDNSGNICFEDYLFDHS